MCPGFSDFCPHLFRKAPYQIFRRVPAQPAREGIREIGGNHFYTFKFKGVKIDVSGDLARSYRVPKPSFPGFLPLIRARRTRLSHRRRSLAPPRRAFCGAGKMLDFRRPANSDLASGARMELRSAKKRGKTVDCGPPRGSAEQMASNDKFLGSEISARQGESRLNRPSGIEQ